MHDEFAHLVMLKALCILQTREIRDQFNTGQVRTKLGPAELATGAVAYGTMPRYIWEQISPCAEYGKAIQTLITFDPRKLHAIYEQMAPLHHYKFVVQ